ncbi:Altered inheritance of mitochondria protein 6 [Rhodosporidiobolus nylandii]
MPPGYNPYHGGDKAAELRAPGGFSRNIPERRIHSHNDYWRDTPVYTALSHGVLSIEADVWLNPKDGVLYVSHNVGSLTRARTFRKLYVKQLLDVLQRANLQDDEQEFFSETDYYTMENEREVRRPWTSFYEGNITPIQLLVDIKTRGNETYHAVLRELSLLRERNWLTQWNSTHIVPGPVQVLLTGNGINLDVRSQIAAQTQRDVFLDAPLLRLGETWEGVDGLTYGWNSTLSPMASSAFSSSTSWTGRFAINETEGKSLGNLIHAAQSGGFKTRLWSAPRWPTFVRDRVWRTLYEIGVDYLDVDDIEAAAAF